MLLDDPQNDIDTKPCLRIGCGRSPQPVNPPAGCAFNPRCPHANESAVAASGLYSKHCIGIKVACHAVLVGGFKPGFIQTMTCVLTPQLRISRRIASLAPVRAQMLHWAIIPYQHTNRCNVHIWAGAGPPSELAASRPARSGGLGGLPLRDADIMRGKQ
jgi:hypothetical protein